MVGVPELIRGSAYGCSMHATFFTCREPRRIDGFFLGKRLRTEDEIAHAPWALCPHGLKCSAATNRVTFMHGDDRLAVLDGATNVKLAVKRREIALGHEH